MRSGQIGVAKELVEIQAQLGGYLLDGDRRLWIREAVAKDGVAGVEAFFDALATREQVLGLGIHEQQLRSGASWVDGVIHRDGYGRVVVGDGEWRDDLGMGEGRWVEVRVVGSDLDAEGVESAVRQLRKELAEQEFMTQAVTVEAPDGAKGDGAAVALAVALVGAGGMVPALIAVLKDWICRRHGPGTVKLTLGDDSIELDKPTFKERQQLLEAFLTER